MKFHDPRPKCSKIIINNFLLIQDIVGTILVTKFHEDQTINVAYRVKNAPPTDIIGTNLLTKFNYGRTINVASRVLTRKNVPPPGVHVFQPTRTIFKPVQHIIRMNLLTKKNAPPLVAIFVLVQDIIETNLLTKFHDDRTINVASRVSKRFFQKLYKAKMPRPLGRHFHEDRTINVASTVLKRKNAPPPGGHVSKTIGTIFGLVQDIILTNLLTKFHDDRKINVASRVLTRKNAPPPGGHIFQQTGIIFKLFQDIIGINLLTKKNAPPLGSHTNLLTEFHEDWTINVASRV
ncbi:hypothetical protein DPMN_186831 [Dreissena polymorpha]|uniref:Uncharacterized protein n=1 Tax=Dreissena polymorpha TaxID=45954 RepID=A0A9D4DNC0_DREPO|nr:hypothetical protein DPMN_186831 [Dreissena polymorpha]